MSMSTFKRSAKRSAERPVKRSVMAAAAIAVGVAGAGALGAVPARADSAALPVTFSAEGSGSSAHYNSDGNIVLDTGPQPADTEVSADLSSLGDDLMPQTPPSFTVDSYVNGNPHWVIELANGALIFGYPAQSGGGANDGFTGDQWEGGSTSGTYQQVLAAVGDASGDVQVTFARIENDGQPLKSTPLTLTNVQYDGETAAPGTAVTVAPVAAQTINVGTAPLPVQVQATTTTAPGTLKYSDNNTLPAGMSVNSGTGVISGAPTAAGTRTATITVTDVAGDSASTQISYTVNPICSTSTGCSWQRLQDPGSLVMYVKGQVPSTNTPIVAYAAQGGDPGADFTAVPSGFGSSQQLTYTPYGTLQTAQNDNPTVAAAAYNADGSAKFCVSTVADTSGQPVELRPCASNANEWQDFVPGAPGANISMIEPTYGTPGVSAGSSPMAINDKGVGGSGTPLINWAAVGSGNELFVPGI